MHYFLKCNKNCKKGILNLVDQLSEGAKYLLHKITSLSDPMYHVPERGQL